MLYVSTFVCFLFHLLNFYYAFTFTTQLSYIIFFVERVTVRPIFFILSPLAAALPLKECRGFFARIELSHLLHEKKEARRLPLVHVPEVIRTPDLPLRRRSLYPAELQRPICWRIISAFQINIFDCIQTLPLNLLPSFGSPRRQLRLIAIMKFNPQQLRSS